MEKIYDANQWIAYPYDNKYMFYVRSYMVEVERMRFSYLYCHFCFVFILGDNYCLCAVSRRVKILTVCVCYRQSCEYSNFLSSAWCILKVARFGWNLKTAFLQSAVMASRRNVRYSSLPTDDNDLDYEGSQYDPRFSYTPKSFDKVPWKSIALAIFLLLLGSLLLFLSYFVLRGHMPGEKSQAYGLLALGVLTFLPGIEISLFYMVFDMWLLLYVYKC